MIHGVKKIPVRIPPGCLENMRANCDISLEIQSNQNIQTTLEKKNVVGHFLLPDFKHVGSWYAMEASEWKKPAPPKTSSGESGSILEEWGWYSNYNVLYLAPVVLAACAGDVRPAGLQCYAHWTT